MASKADKLVLVVNAGSSSLKFKLFTDRSGLKGEVSGLVERIGDLENSRVITNILSGPKPEKATLKKGIEVDGRIDSPGHRCTRGPHPPACMLRVDI